MITTEDNGKVITAKNISKDNYYLIYCEKHNIAFDGFAWTSCPLCTLISEVQSYE